MRTTYAVSFTAQSCSQQQRIEVIDIVSDWLHDNFPNEKRPPGTFVRTREGVDDPVFRLSIDESPPGGTHTKSFTVTIVYINSVLAFDLRSVLIPTTHRVAPSTSREPRQETIAQLVSDVLQRVTVRDANFQLIAQSSVATSLLEGNTFGAFIGAPSRRLPVLVEVADYERKTTSLFRNGAGPLSGIAHIMLINTPAALKGFTEFAGDALLRPGTIRVYWAGGGEPLTLSLRETAPNSYFAERNRLTEAIIEAAASALASPRVPPAPRDDFEDFQDDEADATQNAAIDEYERNIAELQATIADADRIIGEQQAQLERKSGQVDRLILRNVDLETTAGTAAGVKAVASMKEALRLAKHNFSFLVFHDDALKSGERLQGPEPIAVLQDLSRLNEVARAWMSKEISGTSFHIACRGVGLDYAAHISQNSREKFEQDYAIIWKGERVLAEAHIRRGKKNHLFRIHIYLDHDTQQVVVAYIGRHLRGKHSAN